MLRTHQGFVAPTQGKLLNIVHRVPLGVVAQITVSLQTTHRLSELSSERNNKLAFQSSPVHRRKEDCPSVGCWQ